MKRVTCLVCSLLLLFCLAGCSGQPSGGETQAASSGQLAQESAEALLEAEEEGGAMAGSDAFSIALTPEQSENTNTICFVLWQHMENNTCRQVHRDITVDADPQTGEAITQFNGELAYINDDVVCMFASEMGDGYTWYRVPAILNGVDVDLQVLFEDDNPVGQIAGAALVYPDSREASRHLLQIKEGDELTIVYQTKDYVESDDASETRYYWSEGEPRIVQGELSVTKKPVPSGMYFYNFSIVDLQGNTYETNYVEQNY